MSLADGQRSLNDLALGHQFDLEELLDRSALVEMTQSFEALFGVALRIYSSSGTLLADTDKIPSMYTLLAKHQEGRDAVQSLIQAVQAATPGVDEVLSIPCVSGGQYLTSALSYEGRILGRTILGPFVSPSQDSLPGELLGPLDASECEELDLAWQELPRVDDSQAAKLDTHLRATLDLLVFSGLKAHMASSMHMASVQESFRELSDKNRKLQDAYNRLKELDRLKSNFLATVSHELRTPLTSIIGYSEMMIEGISGELNEEQREFLGTIHEKGEQLLELIKSLLDLSKLESGTMSLRRAEVDCNKLIEEVVLTMAPLARKRGVHLLAQAEVKLPLLHADADRLRQVLNNLSENALKFTPKGGSVTVKACRVLLAAEGLGSVGGSLLGAAQRPAIELRVTDTGVGIPEGERLRVFDAFYQVDSSSTREVGGTGLGLSIVKRLVEAHDGTIQVEANEPRGASFVVRVPLARH